MNIVVDYNLLPHQTNVTIGKATSLPPNTVVISEQIPGHVRVTDITTIVEKDGYFGSYNMARDPFIAQVRFYILCPLSCKHLAIIHTHLYTDI